MQKKRKVFWNSLEVKYSKTMKNFKTESRNTYDLNTYSFQILILSQQKLVNVVRAVSSTDFSE